MSPKLEEIEVEHLELPNIREFYDESELDLLGDSLLKGQQSPIIVGPLVGGRRKVYDGSRRVRAARKKQIKKLLAMLLDREPNPDELVAFQLISDIHKQHLSAYERSKAAIAIEKANPALNVKQVAALIDMAETLFWKYLQAKKLGPEALEAYKSGVLGMTDMVEVAKLPHHEQVALLQIKLSGGTREDMSRESKKRRAGKGKSSDSETVTKTLVKIALQGDRSIVIKSKDGLSLAQVAELLLNANREASKNQELGLSVTSFQRVMADRAKQRPKPSKKSASRKQEPAG